MALKDQARDALSRMIAFSGGSQTIDVCDAEASLSCDMLALDLLACSFGRMVITPKALAHSDLNYLKQVSTELTAKLTYLLEPISTIEVDPDGCVVQMRSDPPHQEGGQTSYYELLVRRGGEISLCRYRAPKGQLRSVIPADVTRDVFLRLVEDLSSVK